MSKATKQSMAIILAVGGCLKALEVKSPFSRVDMKESLSESCQLARRAYEGWPGAGRKDKQFAGSVSEKWLKTIRELGGQCNCQTTIAMTAHVLVVELMAKVHDQQKLALLEPLEKALSTFMDFFDHERAHFIAEGNATILSDEVLNLVGWEW